MSFIKEHQGGQQKYQKQNGMKQTELGVNLLQNKEMIVKECGFKYIQTKGR